MRLFYEWSAPASTGARPVRLGTWERQGRGYGNCYMQLVHACTGDYCGGFYACMVIVKNVEKPNVPYKLLPA